MSKKHYKLKPKNYNDEIILGEMCKEVRGLPDFSFRYRPILGIHFSPNKGVNLKTSQIYKDLFLDTIEQNKNVLEFDVLKNLVDSLNDDFIIA